MLIPMEQNHAGISLGRSSGFRNAEAFGRDDWNSRRRLPETGWAVEAWPGRMFDLEQSWCLDFERIENAYDPASYTDPIPDPEIAPPHQTNLKVELGGGKSPRGNGFINLDVEAGPEVDLVCDFEHDRLPFEDDTVSFIYSAHCIEHIDYRHLLKEIVRVCHIGARVEIIVPYWLSPSAMCSGPQTYGFRGSIREPLDAVS